MFKDMLKAKAATNGMSILKFTEQISKKDDPFEDIFGKRKQKKGGMFDPIF